METTRIVWSWYRSLLIRRENAIIASQKQPSLLTLPDDILLLILDELFREGRRGTTHPYWQIRITAHNAFVDLSETNKRMRALASPKLFRTISMGKSWSPERVYAALASLRSCQAVVRHSRELKLDLWLGNTPQTKRQKELALDVVPLMLTMSRLRKLNIAMQEESAHSFQAVCEESEVIFPHVEELVLSPGMDWIIPICPNVRSVSGNDWQCCQALQYRFVEISGRRPQLKHFDFQGKWSEDLLQHVLLHMPHLRSLGMRGSYSTENLLQFLPILRRFEGLEKLRLMGAREMARSLASEYGSRFYFRSCYHSIGQKRITPAQEVITRMLFKNLSSLKELALGWDFQARVVRCAGRRLDIRWELIVECRGKWRGTGFVPTFETCRGCVYDIEDPSIAQRRWLLESDVYHSMQQMATISNELFHDDLTEVSWNVCTFGR